MIEYKLIVESINLSSTFEQVRALTQFEQKVNEALASGYKFHGELVVLPATDISWPLFIQVVVKGSK